MTRKIMIAGAVVLALVVGAGAVFAASETAATGTFCGIGVGRMLGGQNLMTDVEKLTGLSFNDIRTARINGKSLAQLLTEKGKDVKAFVASAVATRKAELDALVASGKITKDQADLVMKNFQANIEQNLNSTTMGPKGAGGAAGGMQGRGAGRGMGRGMGPARGTVAPK